MNIGSNTRFPTLSQQISVPAIFSRALNRPSLEPESSRSLEIGGQVTQEISLSYRETLTALLLDSPIHFPPRPLL